MEHDPFALFTLFWDDRVFKQLAINTNLYANLKPKKWDTLQPGDQKRTLRSWKDTTPGELRIFIGLTIKMGLHKEPGRALYWSRQGRNGWTKIWKRSVHTSGRRRLAKKVHCRLPQNCMSLNRYEQLKQYFHVSDPRVALNIKDWYQKVEPLASILQQRFQQYYLPSTKVAIDEMVVRFCSRSQHTLKIRNKPIKQGYKIFALCNHGYTYAFLWYSATQGIAQLTESSASLNLTPTSRAVLQLAQHLPPNHQWHLILDNYFTNVPLFERLRALGIGAAGTTWVDCTGFPVSLMIEKAEAKKVLPWGHVSGAVVDNTCCLVWQDNSSVLFMTTYHDITKTVEQLRRRPKKTSTNATIVRGIFGDQSRKMLPISEFIDDYNYHMGGVDIADQLRSYYCTQQRSCHNWYPLFYWLLNTTLVNAYRIQKICHSHRLIRSEHYTFRTRVTEKLIQKGLKLQNLKTKPPSTTPASPLFTPLPATTSPTQSSKPEASIHNPTPVTTKWCPCPPTTPPVIPKVIYIPRANSAQKGSKPCPVAHSPPSTHLLEQRPTRSLCIFCRWQRSQHLSPQVKVKSVNLGC